MQVIAEVFGGLSVESGADLQKVLRVHTCTSWSTAIMRLEAMLPVFRSRMGALLFLISALLSRGLVRYLLLYQVSHLYQPRQAHHIHPFFDKYMCSQYS